MPAMRTSIPRKSGGLSIPALATTGLLGLTTVLLGFQLHVQGRKLLRLEQEKNVVLELLASCEAKHKTGMQAYSMSRELEGWEGIPQTPTALLRYFADIPGSLRVDSMRIERPFVFRPLSETNQTAFFKYSLETGGYASIAVDNPEKQNNELRTSMLIDMIKSRLGFQFVVEDKVPEDSAVVQDPWRIHAMLDTAIAWKPDNLEVSP